MFAQRPPLRRGGSCRGSRGGRPMVAPTFTAGTAFKFVGADILARQSLRRLRRHLPLHKGGYPLRWGRADEYPQGAGRICNAPSSRTAALGIGPYIRGGGDGRIGSSAPTFQTEKTPLAVRTHSQGRKLRGTTLIRSVCRSSLQPLTELARPAYYKRSPVLIATIQIIVIGTESQPRFTYVMSEKTFGFDKNWMRQP